MEANVAAEPGRAGVRTRSSAVPPTIVVLLGAVAVSAAFAWANTRYAEWIAAITKTQSPLARGLLFSALPLVLGVLIAARRPRAFGLQVGDSVRRWGVVTITTVALCAVAAIALAMMPSNPFGSSNFVIQAIAVPVSEELVFRGLLFTWVLALLVRFHTPSKATVLAVLISGLAFGVAHLNNLGSYNSTFVLLQTAYAIVLGITAGQLRAVTHSLLPPIVLHAAINIVALVM
jgi:membrane protease YdiL (CAAX protease family)